MKKITLQTRNVEIKTKEKADRRAEELGLGSTQNVIRIFLNDFAEGLITPSTSWKYEEIFSQIKSPIASDRKAMEIANKEIRKYRKSQ